VGHGCLGDIVIDIAQNAAASGADLVELEIARAPDNKSGGLPGPEFRFTVRDNGRGMTEDLLRRVRRNAADFAKALTEPEIAASPATVSESGMAGVTELEIAASPATVSESGAAVVRGRGIPFMARAAEQSGGSWEVSSVLGKGTTVSARFGLAALPVGDMPGTVRTVLLFEGPGEILIRLVRKDGAVYEIRKTALARGLGDLRKAKTLILLDRYLRDSEAFSDLLES
jgi:hypothetical protein